MAFCPPIFLQETSIQLYHACSFPYTIPVDASDNLVNDDYFAQAVNIKSIKEHGTTPHLPQGPEKTADSTAALLKNRAVLMVDDCNYTDKSFHRDGVKAAVINTGYQIIPIAEDARKYQYTT